MATEKLTFTIDLGIETHEGVKEDPFVNISINGYPQFGEIVKRNKTVSFDVVLESHTEHALTVEYFNKDFKYDVVLGEDGVPVKDKTVTVERILIDNIEINLERNASEEYLSYTTMDEHGENFKGYRARQLSWNGTTRLDFATPAYIWLLENL